MLESIMGLPVKNIPQKLKAIRLCVCRAKSLQSCPTPCHPMDCSLPGSSEHGDSPGKNPGMGPSVFQSSQPRDLSCISYISGIGRQVLYH